MRAASTATILVSLPKSMLTQFVGSLSALKLEALDRALVAALGIDIRMSEDQAGSAVRH